MGKALNFQAVGGLFPRRREFFSASLKFSVEFLEKSALFSRKALEKRKFMTGRKKMARVQLIKGGGDSFDLAAALEQAARASGKDENPQSSAFFMAFLEEGASVAAAVYVAKQLAEQSDFPHLGGEGDTKTFGDRVYSPLGYNLG